MCMDYADTEKVNGTIAAFKNLRSEYETAHRNVNSSPSSRTEFTCKVFVRVLDKSLNDISDYEDLVLHGLHDDSISIVVSNDDEIKIRIMKNGESTLYDYPENTPADLLEKGIINEIEATKLEEFIEECEESSFEEDFEESKHEIDEFGVEGEDDE